MAVLFISSSLGAQDNPQQQPQAPKAQPAQQESTKDSPSPAAREKPIETDWSKPDCSNPKDHNEADLCQQRSMADAAKETVWLNTIQIGIGVLTIFGLAFTVYYTRKTAIAAGGAVEAAENSIKIASDNAERQLRAYVSATLQQIKIAKVGDKFFSEATLVIANVGQTPAYSFEQFYDFKLMPWPLPEGYEVQWPTKNMLKDCGVVNPGQDAKGSAIKLLEIDLQTLRQNKERLYLVGVIKFVDLYKRDRGIRFYGSFENTTQLVEHASSGALGSLPTTFHWGYQHNDGDD